MSREHKAEEATLTIDGIEMPVRICAAQIPQFSFDPGAPEGDRTVVWPPLPESVTFTTTEEVIGDTKRFFDAMFESAERDRAFDPWADTHRLNDLGRAPNRQRDIAEFECRFVMRGAPLIVTKAQARELEAIEFDKALYTATDTPFSTPRGALQYTGRSTYRKIATLPPTEELVQRQFEAFKTGSRDLLRDRWGRLKR